MYILGCGHKCTSLYRRPSHTLLYNKIIMVLRELMLTQCAALCTNPACRKIATNSFSVVSCHHFHDKCLFEYSLKDVYCLFLITRWSRDSVIGIVTGYGLNDGGVGVQAPVGSRIFSPRRPDWLLGPPNLLSNGYRG
jgi:hypothetical protein